MTKQEAYDELKSYRQEIARCKSKRVHLDELKSQVESVKITSYGEHAKGAESCYLEAMFDKINGLLEEIAELILTSEKLRKEIERKIETLEFPYSEVLRRRYIDCQSYERISVEMSCNYKQDYKYQYVRNMSCKAVWLYSML